MLLQRVLTALVLIPLVAVALLYLPTDILALLLGALVLLGGVEWTALAELSATKDKLLYMLILVLSMVGLAWLYTHFSSSLFLLATAAACWWFLVALLLAGHPSPADLIQGKTAGRLLLGLAVLVPAWGAMLAVHDGLRNGPYLLLFAMVLIWVADSAAYFAGRRWGRTKLAPALSPGKTREGVYGALVGALICGIFLHMVRPETGPLPLVILFTITVAVFSVVGDLFESLMKRQAGIKDSGKLLPGHGGILDRIDSLTAALPIFLFGLLLMERIS